MSAAAKGVAAQNHASSTIEMTPLADFMGMQIHDVDLGGEVTDTVMDAIKAALAEHTLLLFRNQQSMEPAAHVQFSGRFGALEHHVLQHFCLDGHPEIFVVSNIVENGKHIGAHGGSKQYHSDLAYLPEPSLGSVFRCLECPDEGGETAFVSMFAVFDALSDERKQFLTGRSAIFDYCWDYDRRFTGIRAPLTDAQRAAVPALPQPCVREHPDTGRPALYVSPTWVRRFDDMTEEESRPIIDELMEFACQERFTYRHQWRPGDVLIWDNRSSMHKVCEYDDANTRRLMHRTTIKGDAPIMWRGQD
ncbi:MAG: TauD/TfdA family dioxygenase [Pseudomonadota bacterium]